MVTNAVHGFASMLTYLVRDHQPGALAVAFDLPGDTFRDEMVEDYKAGRATRPTPAAAVRHDPPGLDALAIPVVEAPGFEADDVLATLATEARDRQCDVVVVTGDRDSYQLVEDPYVRVLYNRRGVSDYALYDEAGIEERTGVPPRSTRSWPPCAATLPTTCPGCPGWGRRRRPSTGQQYGDLDGIFAHLDALSPKLRENLAAHEDLVRSNAEVIPLVRDVPLDVHVDELRSAGGTTTGRGSRFAALELRTQLGPHRRPAGVGRAGRTGRWADSGAPRTEDARAPRTARAAADDSVRRPAWSRRRRREVRVPTHGRPGHRPTCGALGDRRT